MSKAARKDLDMSKPRWIICSMVSLLVIGHLYWGAEIGYSQQVEKDSLFRKANLTLEAARQENADFLSPGNFSKGMKYYSGAEADFQKGKKTPRIQTKLDQAIEFFQMAAASAKLARATLAASLKARADAELAGAPTHDAATFNKAETKIVAAIRKLESGSFKTAEKRSAEAEQIYRKAELRAIKINYLNETWELLAKSKKLKVKSYAPKTLAQSHQLITEAEKELNENRYDTDVARSLAHQAKYEARHALYIAQRLKRMRAEKGSLEDLMIESEEPLKKIAGMFDIEAEFDTGYDKVTDQIAAAIADNQKKLTKLTQELAYREEESDGLKARVAELEEQLGGMARQKSELAQRIEKQAKIRKQFLMVESMFTPEEAQILRQSNDVIVRMVGLNFAPGQSLIQARYFGLLTKVQRAIKTFPDCMIIIEGHTDAFGSDELNMRLSKERAEAVMQYLIANMNLGVSRIQAVGHGENRPIASNKTPGGRAKNRRIDVVIQPHL